MLVRFLTFFVFVLTIVSTATITILAQKDNGVATPAVAVASSSNLDRTAVEGIISSFLERKPELIVNAFLAAREKQAKVQEANSGKTIVSKKEQLENNPLTPYVGNPNGDITIVQFSDYNCGYCKRVVPDVIKLLSEDKNIKFIIKDFPILGQRSLVSAKAALAAFALDKNKYFDFHTGMLKNTPRNDEQIYQLANKVGIDGQALKAEMEKPKYDEQLQKNITLAQEIGINGTPAFIINGELIRGAINLAQFKQKIKAIRK